MSRTPRDPDEQNMLWCGDCGEHLDVSKFYQNKKTDKYDTYCKDCRGRRVRRSSGRLSAKDAKDRREIVWLQWFKEEKAKLEAQGHLYPPSYMEEIRAVQAEEEAFASTMSDDSTPEPKRYSNGLTEAEMFALLSQPPVYPNDSGTVEPS